jgi:hypothetical protein
LIAAPLRLKVAQFRIEQSQHTEDILRNLTALKIEPHTYEKNLHSTMFKHMKMANNGFGRAGYHLREGQKEDMHFICLIKADLYSANKNIKGKIGGRDDNKTRRDEKLFIEFEVYCNENGKVFIEINSRDKSTTYEEALRLVHYSLYMMSHSSVELTRPSSGGNGRNKKGYYPQSAQNTGIYTTFNETFDNAVKDDALPEEMRDFFGEADYNLVAFNMDTKKKAIRSKLQSNQL